VNHINVLCSVATLQLASNSCGRIAIFATFSFAMLNCEQALSLPGTVNATMHIRPILKYAVET